MADITKALREDFREMDRALARNRRTLEKSQALEDAEQAAYLAQWCEEHEPDSYGWGTYVMAVIACVILWGAAFAPWIEELVRFGLGRL